VRSSQIRAAAYVAVGTIVSLLAFAGAEARSTLIRIAEYMAISETVDKKEQGFDMLQKLDPKREMMMECANAKAGGLPGMFVKIDNVTMRQLYFSVTGEPFRDEKSANFASMPDDYHKRHVVGAPVDGLSLHRSKMHGYINPDTLTSTIYWTFVFKNKSYESQEARAELGLPEGSVVSGMTLWQDGKPQRTVFSPTGNQGGSTATSWTNVGHDAPGIVTDLGRGRVLLHCYPVPAQGQLKMSVAVSVPLTLHTLEQASLPMPRLIDTNFSLSGQHNLRMLCDSQISLKAKGLTQSKAPTGKYIVSGKIEKETLSGAAVSLKVTRQATLGPIACKDELSKTPRYLIQTIKKIPSIAPKHLVIVLDGSKSVSPYLKDLKEVLNKVSKSIPTSLIVASNQSKEGPRTESLSQALGTLKAVNFKGGQDNLESLVKATELAGESAGGAVLWIHGPQPSFNKEIYIVSQAFAKPDFYELALDNGV
ncbi:MAG: hypothetical protein K8F91_22570, partial [Candidatus Obscuribacterales bacterium]|nr:hypothetical protein [Candidatus Obscuribacterales bacterium]